jgi:hypothetical protein
MGPSLPTLLMLRCSRCGQRLKTVMRPTARDVQRSSSFVRLVRWASARMRWRTTPHLAALGRPACENHQAWLMRAEAGRRGTMPSTTRRRALEALRRGTVLSSNQSFFQTSAGMARSTCSRASGWSMEFWTCGGEARNAEVGNAQV